MDRFSAALLLHRQVTDRAHRQRAHAAEQIAEALALKLGQPVERWSMMALLLHLDSAYAEHNVRARGRVAREMAEAEGLPGDLARMLERCWQQVDAPSPLEDALCLTAWLAAHREERDLAGVLELCRGRGDPEGQRLDGALERLGLEPGPAAELARTALGRDSESRR